MFCHGASAGSCRRERPFPAVVVCHRAEGMDRARRGALAEVLRVAEHVRVPREVNVDGRRQHRRASSHRHLTKPSYREAAATRNASSLYAAPRPATERARVARSPRLSGRRGRRRSGSRVGEGRWEQRGVSVVVVPSEAHARSGVRHCGDERAQSREYACGSRR